MADYRPVNGFKRSGKLTFKTSNASDASNITRTYTALNVYGSDEPSTEGVAFQVFAGLMYDMYTRLSVAIFPTDNRIVTYVREQQYRDAEPT